MYYVMQKQEVTTKETRERILPFNFYKQSCKIRSIYFGWIDFDLFSVCTNILYDYYKYRRIGETNRLKQKKRKKLSELSSNENAGKKTLSTIGNIKKKSVYSKRILILNKNNY